MIATWKQAKPCRHLWRETDADRRGKKQSGESQRTICNYSTSSSGEAESMALDEVSASRPSSTGSRHAPCRETAWKAQSIELGDLALDDADRLGECLLRRKHRVGERPTLISLPALSGAGD